MPARIDVGALGRILDGPRRAVRDEVRSFLAEPEHRPEPEIGMDAYRHLVRDWLGELADRGFGALAYPGITPSILGDAEDVGDFMVSFETLAFGDLSLLVKYGVQFGLFGGSIYSLGTDEQRRRWLPDVASLELPGCFAMIELGHGSNVMEPTARKPAPPPSESSPGSRRPPFMRPPHPLGGWVSLRQKRVE